jgi:hypothetical protein
VVVVDVDGGRSLSSSVDQLVVVVVVGWLVVSLSAVFSVVFPVEPGGWADVG